MGNRSYLLTERDGSFALQLEASDLLPLLWVASAGTAHLQSFATLPCAALGLDADTPAVTVPLSEALENLARRRALVERWLGGAGATVLDQFAGLLRATGAEHVHLALDEWIELHDSRDAALVIVQKAIQALDTDPDKGSPKRRPPPIKWLMDEFGLSGVEDSAPLFGLALAGAMEDDSEPWHRDPPRKQRTPGEALSWTTGDRLISQDGQVVMVRVSNRASLETPLIWNRAADTVDLMAVPESVEDVYPHHITPDGAVIVGGCKAYPGKRQVNFRYRAGSFEFVQVDRSLTFGIQAISADASVLVGHCAPRGEWQREYDTRRAARWQKGELQVIGPDGLVSEAERVTPDGAIVAGYTEQGPLKTRLQRAFVWSVAAGLDDLGAAYFALNWVALSPDGGRGLLRSMSVRGGPWDYHVWERGAALRLIPELHDVAALRVSHAADALLARDPGDGPPMLWTLDAGVRRLDTGGGRAEPLYVADGGRVALLEHADGMLMFTDGGVRTSCVLPAQAMSTIQWRAQNRSPDLEGFVTAGLRRGDRHPLIWTHAGGVQPLPFELPA